ncbi:MAG TPA: DUF6456 domain-containing protein [Pseudolabrys sp.]|jgi:hypothetical protein
MSAPARTARLLETAEPQIGEFRGQHMTLAETQIATDLGRSTVTMDEGESPLVWLARRRGRDGQAMIAPYQLLAGERLRADFTRANMMPRTTSNWESPLSKQRQGAGSTGFITEGTVAARQTEVFIDESCKCFMRLIIFVAGLFGYWTRVTGRDPRA